MDIGRFQAKLTNLIRGKSNNVKGSDVEKIKQDAGLATQTGPNADIVEIDFAQMKAVVQEQPESEVAQLINKISKMTNSEAKAEFKNPEVVEQLVRAGILE